MSISPIIQTLFPVIVFVLVFLMGMIVRALLFRSFSHWAKNTKTEIDDIVISSVSGPSIIWCLMLAIYLALAISSLPTNLVEILGKVLLVLGIFSVTLVLANMTSRLAKKYAAQIDSALPVTSLTENISRIIIFGVGILIVLNSLGISITPILATLGVGGLAVALALQDTLSNLFAGFHVLASGQVRIGDYIKLESGEEGYVTDINWRTTKVRTLPNSVILVPNAKLAQAIIVNYYLPDREMAVLVEVGVACESDLKKVEKITSLVAKEVMKEAAGGVPGFDPFIRYHTLADSSINFTVVLRCKEFTDQYLIKHEFIKKLVERYAQEGIMMPYPTRTVYLKQEKGA